VNKREKGESDKIAQIVLVAAAGISVTVVGLVLIIFHNYQIAEKTGTLGDTIGGIAGPILNFAGLYIIYLSLREQFEANEIQKDSHNKSEKREYTTKNLEICLNLIDRLTIQAKNQVDKVRLLRKEYIHAVNLPLQPHVAEYMLTMEPVLTMFRTIQQLILRAEFDRNQEQALAFVLRYEFLPSLDYLILLLDADKGKMGSDKIIYQQVSIENMLSRVRKCQSWVKAVGALSDNALNEWLN
jgi:hypothetical protein